MEAQVAFATTRQPDITLSRLFCNRLLGETENFWPRLLDIRRSSKGDSHSFLSPAARRSKRAELDNLTIDEPFLQTPAPIHFDLHPKTRIKSRAVDSS